jgi:hypothetical protein
MPSDVHEPAQATSSPQGPQRDPLGSDADAVVPPVPAAAPASPGSSSDDLGLPLTAAAPDPFLEEFVEGGWPERATVPRPASSGSLSPGTFEAVTYPEPVSIGPAAGDKAPHESKLAPSCDLPLSQGAAPAVPTVPSLGSSNPLDRLAVLAPTVGDEEPASGPSAASANAFLALDLSGPPRPRAETSSPETIERDEEEDDLPPRGVSWPVLLLSSLNSALLIFLIWHFYKEHRTPRESVEPGPATPVTSVEESPDPRRRSPPTTRPRWAKPSAWVASKSPRSA